MEIDIKEIILRIEDKRYKIKLPFRTIGNSLAGSSVKSNKREIVLEEIKEDGK